MNKNTHCKGSQSSFTSKNMVSKVSKVSMVTTGRATTTGWFLPMAR